MKQTTDSRSSQWQMISPALQNLVALIVAIIVGSILTKLNFSGQVKAEWIKYLALPSDLLFQAMQTLAIPLVVIAFIYKVDASKIARGARGRRLVLMMLINTAIATLIGALVFYLIYPGAWDYSPFKTIIKGVWYEPWLKLIKGLVPSSIIEPLTKNNIIQIILISVGVSAALQAVKSEEIAYKKEKELKGEIYQTNYQSLGKLLEIINDAAVRILRWLTALLPFAVFGFVVKSILNNGFEEFEKLSSYIIVVLVALFLQVVYYLIRLQLNSWVKPQRFLVNGKEGFLNAFGTASGYASRKSTFQALRNIGLRNSSAGLGASLIQPVNKDGTSLHLAISTLFICLLHSTHLTWVNLFVVILASVFVSVCTAGIPNAGLVTMTLVISSLNIFDGVKLNIGDIALLSTVYWLLDSFTTVINVMGNMTIAAIIDGKKKPLNKNGERGTGNGE